MTARWVVAVRYSQRGALEVEAADYGEAQERAQEAAEAAAPPGFSTSVEILRQDDEPWVRFQYACTGADPTTIVCARATGHKFTPAEVDLLMARVAGLGYTVLRSWNGAGCDSLSIGCADRLGWDKEPVSVDLLTRREVLRRALEEPRPPGVAAAEIERDHGYAILLNGVAP